MSLDDEADAWFNEDPSPKRNGAASTAGEKKRSRKEPSLRAASETLRRECGDILRFDLFSVRTELTGRPPWQPAEVPFAPKIVDDVDLTRARLWLDEAGLRITVEDASRLIEELARRRPHDPVTEWLEEQVWDKTPRLDTWGVECLGADDTPYIRTVCAKALISGVARILRPGCKVDNMLVLEGPQGAGKSRALRALATFGSRCWFTDDLAALGDKDAVLQLAAVVIAEISEMDAILRSRDSSASKSFISRQIDRIRAPYARYVEERPRRCIFAGTFNPNGSAINTDVTGGRRYWFVKCGRIDLDRLEDEQPQLWAEALTRYLKGEPWWLEPGDILDAAREEQDARTYEDSAIGRLATWLKSRTKVTADEILQDVFEAPKRDRNRALETRIGVAMAKMTGWSKRRATVDGVRVWVWEREGATEREGEFDLSY